MKPTDSHSSYKITVNTGWAIEHAGGMARRGGGTRGPPAIRREEVGGGEGTAGRAALRHGDGHCSLVELEGGEREVGGEG